jgi:hypothetical protein
MENDDVSLCLIKKKMSTTRRAARSARPTDSNPSPSTDYAKPKNEKSQSSSNTKEDLLFPKLSLKTIFGVLIISRLISAYFSNIQGIFILEKLII